MNVTEEMKEKLVKASETSNENQGLTKEELKEALQGLVGRYGSSDSALAILYQEKFDLREDKRKLKADLEEKDNTIAELQGKLQKWEVLGELDKVKESVEKYPTLLESLEQTKKEKRLTSLAGTKYHPLVFIDLFGDKELLEEGESVFVMEGEEKIELEDYIEKKIPHYKDSLLVEEEGVKYPKQFKNTGKSKSSTGKGYVANRYGEDLPEYLKK